MNILAIGNSFSQDAAAYMHQTALAQGIDLNITNLYIGGCPLEKHARNLETGEAAYELQINGEFTGKMVGILDMLRKQPWDVVTIQQCSHDSGWIETYEPFLGQLIEAIRREVPGARLMLHETWAYEHGSDHGSFPRYRRNQQEMYDRLRLSYCSMAYKYGLDLIPCGDLIQKARALPAFDTLNGGQTLCRDGYHMNLYGRYLLALTWVKTLCGASVKDNPYQPEPGCGVEDVKPELLQLIRNVVENG